MTYNILLSLSENIIIDVHLTYKERIMAAINYNIRIEQKLRDEAFAVLDSYGLSPSQAIKLFLNQVAKTRSVPLAFDYQKDYSLSTHGETLLCQTIKEFENGEFETFETVDDFNKTVAGMSQ